MLAQLPGQVKPAFGLRLRIMTTTTRWLDDDQQAIWQDLLTIVIGLPTLLDRQLEHDAGTSNFEYSVLARLSMSDGRTLRMSDLATQCNSTRPRLSKVMTRFERQGWVQRTPDPDNGRYMLVRLTDEGLEQVVRSAPGHVERVRQLVFDPLDEPRQDALALGLARVADTVRAQLERS